LAASAVAAVSNAPDRIRTNPTTATMMPAATAAWPRPAKKLNVLFDRGALETDPWRSAGVRCTM